jgi:hypothetical protein
MAGDLDIDRPPGFVSLLFRPVYADENIDGLCTAEAYEPTPQCEELCERGALIPEGEEVALSSGQSFKVEGRTGVPRIDTAYFASRIFDSGRQHRAPLRYRFPAGGADIRKLHLRSFLTKEEKAGVPFWDVAADFNFLLHAAGYLPPETLSAVCDAIAPSLRGKAVSPRQREEGRRAMDTCERLCRAHAGLPPPEDHSEGEMESPLAGCFAGLWRAVNRMLKGSVYGSAEGPGNVA